MLQRKHRKQTMSKETGGGTKKQYQSQENETLMNGVTASKVSSGFIQRTHSVDDNLGEKNSGFKKKEI